MNYANKLVLQNYQYSRRLQECCFLLNNKYNFCDDLPLREFWNEREKYFLKWNDIPQVRSGLEYDLNRACLLCGLSPNLNNYLLIFTFAHYGVWRTTKWLIKEKIQLESGKDLQLAVAYKTINYLYSLILSSREYIRVDPLVDIFIENNVFKWIEENNMGITFTEKPSNENEQKDFFHLVTETFPLEIANMIESMSDDNYGDHTTTEKRRTPETKRNYYYWRWSKRGLTLFEMGMKWEKLNNPESYHDYDRASVDDKVNKGLKSYISTHGPLLENLSTIEWFRHFLKYYPQQEAAERVFEMAAEKVHDVLESEMKVRLNKRFSEPEIN
ncbi:hypothetical protein M3226_00865 [Neobacillus cucumis]|uniref:hypothetical protein n=1 Tax=Neobacillus cucumis TaxID=1740721 RepID=UPI00203FEA4B|nr:hypothetical protein [Neobacillus cucumis]MCM3724253.1 hypothetical protein [Neobacillus cucumis]